MLARRPEFVQLVDLFGIVTLQPQVRATQKQKLHRLDVKSVQIRKLPVEDHVGCTKQLAMAGCRLCRPADVEGSYFSGVVADCKARTLVRIHVAESSEAKVGQERHRLQEILMQNHRELLELSTTTTPDDKKAASDVGVQCTGEALTMSAYVFVQGAHLRDGQRAG